MAQIGQSVSVPEVVSPNPYQTATTLQHGRRAQNLIDHVYISVTDVEKSWSF